MNLSRMFIVTRKELTDGFRDRRAIYTILFSTLFGPLLISFMLSKIAGQQKAAQEIQVPVVGRELAPVLVNWLEQQSGVEVVQGPADPEAAVRDSKADVVLVIEKDFAERFRDSRPAPVQVVSDSTRQPAQPKVKRLMSLLNRFSAETGSLRLIARGISPPVASALKVEEVEVSSAQQRAAVVLNVIPMFLILAAFTAGMQISTDSTAGERERGSLEPLLLNPVARWQLVGGKWLAAAVAAFIGMAGTLVVLSQVLSRLSLEDLGVRFHLDRPEMLLLIAAVAPMAFVAPAVQMYLACFAKSFKEAQSYMAFLVAGAVIPGVLSIFYPMGNRPWMQPVPVLGQYAMVNEILSGRIPSPLMMIAAAVPALALACVFVWLASRLFSSEKIIFGR
ncbi:MAG TPA: ABC transporter permease [Bryobacteraceae bacterium]|nr:ABC transporter permease [Bryobacteraceae bacterium]